MKCQVTIDAEINQATLNALQKKMSDARTALLVVTSSPNFTVSGNIVEVQVTQDDVISRKKVRA